MRTSSRASASGSEVDGLCEGIVRALLGAVLGIMENVYPNGRSAAPSAARSGQTLFLLAFQGLDENGAFRQSRDDNTGIATLSAAKSATAQPARQEKNREITNRYSTFEQALRIFFEDVGVTNYAEFFPEALQPRLFDEHS